MSDAFWSGAGSSIAGSAGNFLSDLYFHNRTAKREDTAVQRRVADLKAAGLHPALAAGSAAAASPASGVNPVDKMEPTESKIDQEKRREIEEQQRLYTKAMVDQTNADADLIRSKADAEDWDTLLNMTHGQTRASSGGILGTLTKGAALPVFLAQNLDQVRSRRDAVVHRMMKRNRGAQDDE